MLDKLGGDWYLYKYSMNEKINIWKFKIHIYNNFSVKIKDLNLKESIQYEGKLKIYKKQSMLITNNKDTGYKMVIMFDNERIKRLMFCCFHSKAYIQLKNMVGVALLSRDKIAKDEVEKILGEKEKCQIIVDQYFLTRIIDYQTRL